ncbi:Sensor histidine kinase RcsC [Sphingomonas sp. S2M10]|uniref:sensor histidine kinase n=1 Tax=Sphingomonas sp. S2M10 TaxID=2705010 RepID=UPI00145696EC|nr:ATP-binding protein [Sphingomonas sp. S2M10]NLS27221.1 Sensor histidine kinase RcsC [Sphingomonas sp. S2M10]
MLSAQGFRIVLAMGVAALSALVGFLLNGDLQVALLLLVGAVASVLVVAIGGDPAPPPRDDAAAADRDPAFGEVIEAIAEPVLVIAATRVIAANAAARALLGEHILGEDVRLAIRHPAAAERLLDPSEDHSAAPIHLVGLGTREQRWEMRVRTLETGERVVHLVDRTGSYTADRMRVDFVANASHELRTPLASLLGYVETLADGAGEEPEIRQRFLKIMHDEARRMDRLISDLISLSRIEAEKYRTPAESVQLADLIPQVCAELSANPRAGDLVTEIETVAPVRGDRTQLSQLLHNLIGNAMKYGRPGTPVTVSLRSEGDTMVRFSVADQGEGIPPEHIPRLTERFYRVDSGRSRSLGGTGLGLAIVKHVVERHRGRLDIASTVGVGTTVAVRLPIEPNVIKP